MHEEEVLGKAYDNRLMKRLLTYLRPYVWHVVAAILMSILVSGMEAIRPWFTKHAVDVNIAERDMRGLLITALIFLAVLIVRGVVQYLNTYLTQWIGQRTISRISV